LGIKKNIKCQFKFCFTCGKPLKFNERNINKIRSEKKHSKFNSVVICSECHKYMQVNRIKIWELIIPKYCLQRYCEDKYFVKALLHKIIEIRKLNESSQEL